MDQKKKLHHYSSKKNRIKIAKKPTFIILYNSVYGRYVEGIYVTSNSKKPFVTKKKRNAS
jgi:hypothetical protein